MRRCRRGATIGSYLAALTVFAVFLLTMVTMATQHLHFSSMAYQQQAAKNLAEAAIQQALIKVVESDSALFGAARRVDHLVTVNNTLYPGNSRGLVVFNKMVAQGQKIPFSTNNFNGGGEVAGDLGRSVPINTLHLVGTGYCGEAKRTVEAVYYVPPFPSALASEGPIRSNGALLVAGVRDPSLFPGRYENLPAKEKTPSHVFSNSHDPEEAVVLGAGAQIKGNVGAVGGVKVTRSDVMGEVKPFSPPQALPRIDMDAIFARLDQQVGKDSLGPTYPGDYNLEWNAQCDTDLHITGQLTLHQGVLFVKGNLEVDGGITGEGLIYVGGRTIVHRGADFRSADQVALMSKQRIELDGAGQNDYFFQGMVYSEQDIVARQITVLGACIARGVGGLSFENVNALNAPVTVSLIEGVELRNASDDDTVQIIVRVEERDPVTRQPKSYKVQLRGTSDDYPINNHSKVQLSPPIEGHGLRNYEEVKNFIEHSDRGVWGPYAKNSFHLDWYWNGGDHSEVYGDNPLRNYLAMLDGRLPDPNRHFGLNLNPNELIGILDRSRVLLWRDIANPI
ncbi:MAG: hypothetical protein KF760_26410 [Candidatus Eremiobacteraeota bacterium]|nr:hypothetical protein [Candidatus Eremiobacteraeota bacterium]MCW5869528.1 hypothetical protein [Candidatus Eremiobacteraeota bacterium]